MLQLEVHVDIVALLDEIQSIARNGLSFAESPYDRERYERLLELSLQSYQDQLALPKAALRRRFQNELGYITPKVGADAAIFNEQGDILLMERADGGGWCLPCGWVNPNERPRDAAVRETWEETGLIVEVSRLVGVFTRMPSARNGPHTMIAVVHLCRVVGGELTLSPEGLDLRFWPIEAVSNWHGIHEKYARAAHAMWRKKPMSAQSD
jgi:ADP-ribose pyrophosphatase YjhB (NUDIX family)